MSEIKNEWKNWSGSLRFKPGEILNPESEEEVVHLVKSAALINRKIRVVGPGHSMRLEQNYSCYIRSNIKVAVQFSRMNTGAATNGEMSTLAFPADT